MLILAGGGGGIRTHETLSGLTVFKTAGVNRFPTPPYDFEFTRSKRMFQLRWSYKYEPGSRFRNIAGANHSRRLRVL